MLYVPPISDYKPFYIQFASGDAKDIKTVYSVVIKAHDYPSAFKVKEPYKNQWHDEHGDDEYISASGLYVDAFTFKLECAMFSRNTTEALAIQDLQAGLSAFRTALLQGHFKTYDAWTGFGFQKVRLQEFPNVDPSNYSVWESYSGSVNSGSIRGCTRLIFPVTLKVNDPVTHMVLSGTNIVAG